MKKLILNVMLMQLCLNASTTWANDTFYKWVDRNGTTHYTLTPPPKGSKSLGKMQTYRDFSYPIQPVQNNVPATTQNNEISKNEQTNTPSNNDVKSEPTVQGEFIPLPK